jgi:hypothetical protein
MFDHKPIILQSFAGLAQLVEHLICNQGVRGSSPLAGTTINLVQPGDIGNRTYLRHG